MTASPGQPAGGPDSTVGQASAADSPLEPRLPGSYNAARLPPPLEAAEQDYTKKRRDAAGLPAGSSTLGLALSGGGIRSASFNLGFVQGLIAHKKFREVDFLSTVSGGGYLGGFLGSQLAQLEQENAAQADSQSSLVAQLPSYRRTVSPKTTGEQPASVKRLLRSGRYLRRVPRFINRYLFGLVLLNLWIFCGLAAAGALAAWVFRWVDFRPVIHFATAAGFAGDIPRAFMPAFFCFVVWMLCWILRYVAARRGGEGQTHRCDAVTRSVVLGLIVLLALGFVSVLATGDLATPAPALAVTSGLNQASQVLGLVLVVLQLLALIPAFRLDKLVQSGARPRGRTDRMIFNLIAPAIVFGLPLLAFGWFAREDVSARIEHARLKDFDDNDPRNPRLLSFLHIANWPEFWRRLQERAGSDSPPLLETRLLQAANRADRTEGMRATETPVEASIRIAEEYQDEVAGMPPLLGIHKFHTLWTLRHEKDASQAAIIAEVNLLLGQGDFVGGTLSEPRVLYPVDPERARALAQRAEGLRRSALERPRGRDEESPEWMSFRRWRAAMRRVNRQFLQAYFGDEMLRPADTVFSWTTWHADQRYRLLCGGAFTVAWLVLGLIINPNHASLHEFYRERLRYMWLRRRRVKGQQENQPVRLSELEQPEDRPGHDFPYLIVNATANVFRDDLGTLFGQEADERPRQARFEFAPAYCGYSRHSSGGYVSHFALTPEFEKQANLDLPGVMAISGSAVSPAMTSNFVLKSLLFLANLRLGQWVEQPGHRPHRWKRLTLLRCIYSTLASTREAPRFVFLSDGGHYDNLGLEALLDRRLDTIICVDAGHDPDCRFTDLLKVLRRSRFIDGVRVTTSEDGDDLEFAELEQVKGKVARAHFFCACIRYPDKKVGRLYYVKPSFDMDEPAELINYRDENPDFPHDPTLDQFYDERRFESYRSLGWHIADKLVHAHRRLHAPAVQQSLRVVERIATERPSSALQRILVQVSSTHDERGEALMQLKEELLQRQLDNEPLTADEQWEVSRALGQCLHARDRDDWENAVLFDCITDLVAAGMEQGEHMLRAALDDAQLKPCAEHLLEWLRNQKRP